MISRRTLLSGLLFAGPAWLSLQAAAEARSSALTQRFAALEQKYGGRLGVAILDTGTHQRITYRGSERFPMCSTYKLLATAFILARIDRKQESLTRRIVYTKADLVTYSPITEKHVGLGGLTVGEICAATMTLSDNTAANLQLDSFGGPAGLTAYLRSLGDSVSRLDRRETELNEAKPGDPRDTTTPMAMLETMRKILLGTTLSPASRHQLKSWMLACKTGDNRLRAGIPKGWRVGDKTGSGERNTRNDVAILWPPGRAPILVTAYYTGSHASEDQLKAVFSEIGHLAASV